MLPIILIFFITLIDSSPNKQCPYPLCKTTYINSSFCSIYCSENTIPDPCLAKINQIDGFILNNVSYLKKDAFNNVDVNFLQLQNSDLKNVSELAFRVDKMSLKEFILDNTKLVDVNLDLNMNKNLKKLLLRSDQIESFRIILNQYLESIDLFNNIIENFEIIGGSYSKLTSINLNKNLLSTIKFPNLQNLSKLNLDGNLIRNTSCLNLDILIGLNDLSLGHNQIESIDFISLEKLTRLQIIFLNDNLLVDSANFFSLKYLLSLQLAGNKLKNIIADNFRGLDSLLNLDLSYNDIEFVQLNITSLTYLSLKGNRIKFFDSELLRCTVSNNSISELLDLVNFQSLKEIFLTKNRIKNLTYNLELFYNHSKIYLSNNLIENLPIFPKFENLLEIYLRNNKLSIIEKETFSNLNNLEILDLYGNMIFLIDPLAFSTNRKLRNLNLADNNLSIIPNLNKLENLEFIYLTNQSNRIELFDYDFDLSTNKILRIYLINNKLEYIHSKAFCSKKNVNLELYLDDINLLHNCMLNQFNGKNVSVISIEKANCLITKQAELNTINLNEKSECDNFDLVVDCDKIKNLKYDCNSNNLDYERETKWLYTVNSEFINNTQEIIYKCIENLFFQIKCSFIENSSFYFISQIYFCEKEQCFGIDNGDLYKKDFILKNFHIISLSKNTLVFYHVKTSTFFIAQKIGGYYFIILRAYKVILEKSSGFLFNGSIKNASHLNGINFSVFQIIDNDIERYNVRNSVYNFKKLLSLNESVFSPYLINFSFSIKCVFKFLVIGILFLQTFILYLNLNLG
ncbi:unnamed protein product [Brachionus calyciflorus]|uniref:Uncharacterized protein n=1 Tax=Brachionus calyciflorus TaxID=104777 RepID=A0A813WK46_9BILA|nr:unnamed protein product [Brachionus calyciflorus]